MQLNYYLKNELHQLEVHQACPGCGELEQLTVRKRVTSFMRDVGEYYIGCNCGWLGPISDAPLDAARLWDLRFDPDYDLKVLNRKLHEGIIHDHSNR